ncbi:MAG: ABC transporter ATP-binding protein [Lachnospiraceae bacterium]|nr:ABC transporter ATP-binding protein [Lachnospiraceae bacterium]
MSEILFDNVSVGYGHKRVASDLSFSVEKAEITALIGPNGAGKTTILKTASGLIDALGGEVYIKDRPISQFSRNELYSLISVMMTERVRTGYMSSHDVVRVGRYRHSGVFGGLSAEDKRAIRESMDLIGVWELRDEDYNKLSDGQKQRVLLARAIVSEPGILIMDEPASFLDMGRKIEFFDALSELVKNKGITVLISMHETEMVKKVADRVICISQEGRTDRIGTPGDILTTDYMEKLYRIKDGRYEEYYG